MAAGPEAPRADRRWGRIGAATLRLLTVNHGAQRTTKLTARQLYSAVMGLQVRIWHARGQGFKSPQLHPRSTAQSGLGRPRIVRSRQQIGSNRRCAGRSVAHQSVTPAVLVGVVSWSDLPNAITRCWEAVRGFEASASGPGGWPRSDVVRTQHGPAPRPGLARSSPPAGVFGAPGLPRSGTGSAGTAWHDRPRLGWRSALRR
jgi:hypothetical protein